MKWETATNKQLKNIIEWDESCPAPLLFGVYEEAVKREVHKHFVIACIIKYFRSTDRAEQLTKMTTDELKWLCYERGFEAIKIFKPGNRPFIALWSHVITKALRDVARTHQAQKRMADIIDIDHAGIMPPSALNTEKTALRRIYITSLLNQMSDTEKQIAIKRYQGYTLDEIASMQGITKSGIQRRIKTYLSRIRESGIVEFSQIV